MYLVRIVGIWIDGRPVPMSVEESDCQQFPLVTFDGRKRHCDKKIRLNFRQMKHIGLRRDDILLHAFYFSSPC